MKFTFENKNRHKIGITAWAQLTPGDVSAAREYIHDWWQQATRTTKRTKGTLIGVPRPYIIPSYDPSSTFDYEELYYWDSYFIIQGLLDPEHRELVDGILADLLELLKAYGIVPNGSRTYLTGHSQPPFLTSIIFDVYERHHRSGAWLQAAIKHAEQEYYDVWMGTRKPDDRLVYQGLSRYYDINLIDGLAETESGWDMTPRFHRRALDYLPVDLNALLYKYETDFAKAARLRGDRAAAHLWEGRAGTRKKTMDELMWDDAREMYFDYNYVRRCRGNVASLATYFPMWAGMVSEGRAAKLAESLRHFEFAGGLAATAPMRLGYRLQRYRAVQWAYPNGWAPLHFITVQALERYNFHDTAKRLALKWVATDLDWFNTHHEFLEKYNVVSPRRPAVNGLYPAQKGFGWTNAVFERFCRDYIDASE